MGNLKDYKFWLNLFLDKEKDFSYKEYLLSSFGVLGSKIKTFLKTISGTILSFDDGVAKPAVSLIAHFEPVQEGTGDPSPDNVRPISGFTGMDVVVSLTTDAQDGTIYPITFPSEAGTVYGGYVDVTNGKLVVDRAFMLLNNPERWTASASLDATIDFRYDTNVVDRKIFNNSFDGLMCSYAAVNKNTPKNSARWSGASSATFGFKGLGLTLEQIKSDAEQGKISIVYELETPIEYDITPTAIELLKGYNNVWNSAGGNNELTYIGTKKGN